MRTILLSVVLSFFLAACITTNVKSYTDTDFLTAKVGRVIIDMKQLPPTVRDDVESAVSGKLKAVGIAVTSLAQVLPPTRDLSPDEAKLLVSQSGFDAILTLQITGDKERTTYGGSINTNTMNAYVYGNHVNAYGTGLSVPLVNSQGTTTFTATLFDAQTGRKIWVADLNTKAQGLAFVGRMDKIAESASEALVAKLREDGRL